MSRLNTRSIEHLKDRDLLTPRWSHDGRDHVVICLTADGVLGHRGHFSSPGTPVDEWHRRTITWAVQPDQRAAAVRDTILDNLPLFERVHAGHAIVWDGQNMVGRLDADAQAADVEIEGLLSGLPVSDDDKIARYDADFWFGSVTDMFAGCDDDQLEVLVRREVHDGEPFLEGDGWVVIDVDDALAYAREVRDNDARQRK